MCVYVIVREKQECGITRPLGWILVSTPEFHEGFSAGGGGHTLSFFFNCGGRERRRLWEGGGGGDPRPSPPLYEALHPLLVPPLDCGNGNTGL